MSIPSAPMIPLLAAVGIMIALAVSPLINPPACGPGTANETQVTFPVQGAPARVQAEVARTPEELSRGLMHRASLGEDQGMLFIFPDDAPRTFWMKDTLIPLDMIFINSSHHVVSVQSQAQPCPADPCPTYGSGLPAMYVVEVNGGFAEAHGILEGQEVRIDTLCSQSDAWHPTLKAGMEPLNTPNVTIKQ